MGKARTSSENCNVTRKCAQRFQMEGVTRIETRILDESGSENTAAINKMLNNSQVSNSNNPLLYIPPRIPRGIVKRTLRRRSRQKKSIGDGRGSREKTAVEATKDGTDKSNGVPVLQDSLAGCTIHGKQYILSNSRGPSNHGLLNGYPGAEITSKQERVPSKGKELPEGGLDAETGTLGCVRDKQSFDLEPPSIPEVLSIAGPVAIAEPMGSSVEKRTSELCGDASKESKRKEASSKECHSMERFDLFEQQESPTSLIVQPAVVQHSQVSGEGTSDSTVYIGRNEVIVERNRSPFCSALGPSGVDMRLNLSPVGSAPLLERAVIRTSGLVPMTLLASFIHCSLRLPGEQNISLRCCGVDLGSVMALTLQQFTKCMRIEPGGILELEYEIL